MRVSLAVCLLVLAGAGRPPVETYRPGQECKAEIAALTKQIVSVSDPAKRAALNNDLRRAKREANEGDEDECADYIDDAKKILQPVK